MEEMLNYVSNMGFPIVVSVYLLVRFEKKMDALATSIGRLDGTIEKMMNDK